MLESTIVSLFLVFYSLFVLLLVKSAVENLEVINKQVGKTDFSLLMDILTEKMTSLEFKDFTNFIVSSIKVS